jgi:dsRNA-specific ribonuclease
MKRIRLERWSGQFLPATRPLCMHIRCLTVRLHSTASSTDSEIYYEDGPPSFLSQSTAPRASFPPNSPAPERALSSPKLSALHARLHLPLKLPLQTLARTLVHKSADPDPHFNNASLCELGHKLLGSYVAEHLICRYPRLPLAVLFAAMWAFVGSEALTTISREWGLEIAAEPGVEVDPGLLQLRRLKPGEKPVAEFKSGVLRRPNERQGWRRGISSRIVYDDEFGDHPSSRNGTASESLEDGTQVHHAVPVSAASASFVQALVGALYLHAGRQSAISFFRMHILPRHLPLHQLFSFTQPTRDLSRLCAREGFRSPVARLISETGRKSRTPVFVVGVYSGEEKLGEGSGGSLDEARTRAAAAALRAWYLYSPGEARVPSDMENETARTWKPVMIDKGEVIV